MEQFFDLNMLNENKDNNNEKSEYQVINVINNLLKETGILDYDPVIVEQLLYFMYDHVTTILENAEVFAEHANKKQIDVSDIALALRFQKENDINPIPRKVNLDLASERNNISLPDIKTTDGLLIPPEKHCLANRNYKLRVPVPILKQQYLHNMQYFVGENSQTLLKKPKIANIPGDRIVFRPKLKFNIKSQDQELEIKKRRAI